MDQTSSVKHQSAFSRWLRTGRLPEIRISDEVEFKFNPWHDPVDGRFTFAGSGHYYGADGANPAYRTPSSGRDNPRKPSIATGPKQETARAGQPARSGKAREATAVRPKPDGTSRLRREPNSAAEFVGGVGQGLYGVVEGTVSAVHSALTTNPVTTVRNVGRGIADVIDTAIAAEDTPARIQISRAADAIDNASAREIGRATGSVVGNVALAVAPSAAIGKVSAPRRLRGVAPGTTYDVPQIGWVKENLGRDTLAKRYNDSRRAPNPAKRRR
jgi:hypothetical protein